MAGGKRGRGRPKMKLWVNNFAKHNDAKKNNSGNSSDSIDGTVTLPSLFMAKILLTTMQVRLRLKQALAQEEKSAIQIA